MKNFLQSTVLTLLSASFADVMFYVNLIQKLFVDIELLGKFFADVCNSEHMRYKEKYFQ